MKIAQSTLRKVIQEEIAAVTKESRSVTAEPVGTAIERYPERPEEEGSTASSRLAGNPEEQALAKISLQNAIDGYESAGDLAAALGIALTDDLMVTFDAVKRIFRGKK